MHAPGIPHSAMPLPTGRVSPSSGSPSTSSRSSPRSSAPDARSSNPSSDTCAMILSWLRTAVPTILQAAGHRPRRSRSENPVQALTNMLSDGVVLADLVAFLDPARLPASAVIRGSARNALSLPSQQPTSDSPSNIDARQLFVQYKTNTRRVLSALKKNLDDVRMFSGFPHHPIPGAVDAYLKNVASIPPSQDLFPSARLAQLVIACAVYGPRHNEFRHSIWRFPTDAIQKAFLLAMSSVSQAVALPPPDVLYAAGPPPPHHVPTPPNMLSPHMLSPTAFGSSPRPPLSPSFMPSPTPLSPRASFIPNPVLAPNLNASPPVISSPPGSNVRPPSMSRNSVSLRTQQQQSPNRPLRISQQSIVSSRSPSRSSPRNQQPSPMAQSPVPSSSPKPPLPQPRGTSPRVALNNPLVTRHSPSSSRTTSRPVAMALPSAPLTEETSRVLSQNVQIDDTLGIRKFSIVTEEETRSVSPPEASSTNSRTPATTDVSGELPPVSSAARAAIHTEIVQSMRVLEQRRKLDHVQVRVNRVEERPVATELYAVEPEPQSKRSSDEFYTPREESPCLSPDEPSTSNAPLASRSRPLQSSFSEDLMTPPVTEKFGDEATKKIQQESKVDERVRQSVATSITEHISRASAMHSNLQVLNGEGESVGTAPQLFRNDSNPSSIDMRDHSYLLSPSASDVPSPSNQWQISQQKGMGHDILSPLPMFSPPSMPPTHTRTGMSTQMTPPRDLQPAPSLFRPGMESPQLSVSSAGAPSTIELPKACGDPADKELHSISSSDPPLPAIRSKTSRPLSLPPRPPLHARPPLPSPQKSPLRPSYSLPGSSSQHHSLPSGKSRVSFAPTIISPGGHERPLGKPLKESTVVSNPKPSGPPKVSSTMFSLPPSAAGGDSVTPSPAENVTPVSVSSSELRNLKDVGSMTENAEHEVEAIDPEVTTSELCANVDIVDEDGEEEGDNEDDLGNEGPTNHDDEEVPDESDEHYIDQDDGASNEDDDEMQNLHDNDDVPEGSQGDAFDENFSRDIGSSPSYADDEERLRGSDLDVAEELAESGETPLDEIQERSIDEAMMDLNENGDSFLEKTTFQRVEEYVVYNSDENDGKSPEEEQEAVDLSEVERATALHAESQYRQEDPHDEAEFDEDEEYVEEEIAVPTKHDLQREGSDHDIGIEPAAEEEVGPVVSSPGTNHERTQDTQLEEARNVLSMSAGGAAGIESDIPGVAGYVPSAADFITPPAAVRYSRSGRNLPMPSDVPMTPPSPPDVGKIIQSISSSRLSGAEFDGVEDDDDDDGPVSTMQPSAGLFQKLIAVWQSADEQGVRPESITSSVLDRRASHVFVPEVSLSSPSPQTSTVPSRETGVEHGKMPQDRTDSSRSHRPRAMRLPHGVMSPSVVTREPSALERKEDVEEGTSMASFSDAFSSDDKDRVWPETTNMNSEGREWEEALKGDNNVGLPLSPPAITTQTAGPSNVRIERTVQTSQGAELYSRGAPRRYKSVRGDASGVMTDGHHVKVDRRRLDWLTRELLSARDAISRKELQMTFAETQRLEQEEILLLERQDAESMVEAMKKILVEREGELQEARTRLSMAIQSSGPAAEQGQSSEGPPAGERVSVESRSSNVGGSLEKMITEGNAKLHERFDECGEKHAEANQIMGGEMRALWSEVQKAMVEKMEEMTEKRDEELEVLRKELINRERLITDLKQSSSDLVDQNRAMQAEASDLRLQKEKTAHRYELEMAHVTAQVELVNEFSKKLHDNFRETENLRQQVLQYQEKLAHITSASGVSQRQIKELREAVTRANDECARLRREAELAKKKGMEAVRRAEELEELRCKDVAAQTGRYPDRQDSGSFRSHEPVRPAGHNRPGGSGVNARYHVTNRSRALPQTSHASKAWAVIKEKLGIVGKENTHPRRRVPAGHRDVMRVGVGGAGSQSSRSQSRSRGTREDDGSIYSRTASRSSAGSGGSGSVGGSSAHSGVQRSNRSGSGGSRSGSGGVGRHDVVNGNVEGGSGFMRDAGYGSDEIRATDF